MSTSPQKLASKIVGSTGEKQGSEPNYNRFLFDLTENRHLNIKNPKTYNTPYQYKQFEDKIQISEANNAQTKRINQLIDEASQKTNKTGEFWEQGKFKNADFQDLIVQK